MSAGPLTLGTAGHVDHGKSVLIRALTGVDTDRLPEEQARGISIELGYASLELPSGARLSVIDVPGHERYVRTMVAGATGIDLYLMVIAADDGVMPQTREHARVLRALGVARGVVAITKADLADPEPAMLEAAELLGDPQLVAVSARTGEGLDELREALDALAAELPRRGEQPAAAGTRLHVDRVFSIRGAGTVVTGTLWSGEIARGDRVSVLPEHRSARVREVQVHDTPQERAAAGQRVAVNLAGLGPDQVNRGDVLVAKGSAVQEAFLLDVELDLAADVREPASGDRIQVHHGTRETPGRAAWLGGDFWQLRLEQPLIAEAGDRLVLRQIAPPDTLGGGRVLDAHPRKHGPSRELLARLHRLARGEPDPAPEGSGGTPEAGVEPGPSRAAPAVERAPAPEAPPVLSASALELEARLRQAGFAAPGDGELDSGDLAALRAAGRAVRVSRSLHLHPEVLSAGRERVLELAARSGGSVTIASVRDELGTSRRLAQALLEHLDAQRVTIRRGDEHVVRRAHR
jgi:selenocysteine-specific elongation factor